MKVLSCTTIEVIQNVQKKKGRWTNNENVGIFWLLEKWIKETKVPAIQGQHS